jgi:UDP-N-acetylglucosamine acyltransferase
MSDFYHSEWINIEGNHIHRTAIIHPNVRMGKGNWIGAYAVIGGNGEIRGKAQTDFAGWVEIGDNNVISELVTIQRPFDQTPTRIGSGNIIMAHAHVGHDATIGDNCEICTGVIIGGYAVIKDEAKVKLGVTVRNRKTVGTGALVGLGAAVVADVGDGEVWFGNPAKSKAKIENVDWPLK